MKLKQKVEKGVTLIELLIALSIVSVVMVGIGSQMKVGGDVWQSADKHTELLQNGLIGMDKMTRELKQAESITDIKYPIVDDKGKPIINEDKSISYKSIDFIDVNDFSSNFQYNNSNNYLEYNDVQLAGPITSLKFTCYRSDGVTPINDTAYSDRIRLVKIDMVAQEGSTSTIQVPVSSAVSVGDKTYIDEFLDNDDKENNINVLYNYAIFGGNGVTMKNGSLVGSYQSSLAKSYKDPPANIGTLKSVIIKNNLTLYGSITAGGSITTGNKLEGGAPTEDGKPAISPDTAFNNFHLPDPAPAPIPSTLYKDWTTNQTLTPGKYYFNSIPGGATINIEIGETDVDNNNGVQIFIKENLGEDNKDINMTLYNGEPTTAEDMKKVALIYVEVQGNIIATKGGGSSLIGTVYASGEGTGKGNIDFKNNLTVYGSLYARGMVADIDKPNAPTNNPTVIFVPANINVLPDTWFE
jgi:prepilin-type N-terminal cleavage/methylation domain-containing protein